MKCQMTRAGAKHLLTRKSTSWLMALGCLIASPPPMKSGEPGPEPHLVERAIRKGTEFIGFAAVPKAGFHEFYTADLQSGHSGCSEKHTDFCVETISRMGGTFLDAHRITTDPIHLKAAEKCAETLIVGQRQSGAGQGPSTWPRRTEGRSGTSIAWTEARSPIRMIPSSMPHTRAGTTGESANSPTTPPCWKGTPHLQPCFS